MAIEMYSISPPDEKTLAAIFSTLPSKLPVENAANNISTPTQSPVHS